jgi:hypothetical protein
MSYKYRCSIVIISAILKVLCAITHRNLNILIWLPINKLNFRQSPTLHRPNGAATGGETNEIYTVYC